MVTIFHNPMCGTSRNTLAILDILVEPQRGAFAKEDGEVVINEKGLRV